MIRRLTVGLSVALAVVVTTMGVRRSDWAASIARSKSYYELRLGRGRVALTRINSWPIDQKLKHGRAIPATDDKAPTADAFLLLDGGTVTLTPDDQRWWRPGYVGGNAIVSGSGDPFSTTLSTASPLQPVTKIEFSGGSLSVTHTSVSTAPTTVSSVTFMPAPTTKPGAKSFSISGMSGAPAAPATLITPTGNLTFNGNVIFYSAPRRYSQFRLKVVSADAIVLAPAWIVVSLAMVRAWRKMRRRKRGQCEACGYDLRGGGDVCPECGATPSQKPSIARAL